jgi:hypothetical protein
VGHVYSLNTNESVEINVTTISITDVNVSKADGINLVTMLIQWQAFNLNFSADVISKSKK